MLIPCIDVMDGKIVQLIGGRKRALEFDDPTPWLERFAKYPLVHIVDLDAAMGKGTNRALISRLANAVTCQIGGGVRTLDDAKELLAIGGRRVVIGSALVRAGKLDATFAASLAQRLGPERLVFALDTKQGLLAISGWKESVPLRALDVIPELQPFCSAFLYTNVDREGTMTGFPMDEARSLRGTTDKQLMVGGGINTNAQIEQLNSIGVDAIVGMAVYTGLIKA